MSDIWAGVDIKRRLKEAMKKSADAKEEIRQQWLTEWEDRKKSPSILFEFIACRSKHYQEPNRKGLRKGEEIGPSRKQYIASLWVGLTNLSLKHIAEINKADAGLSYQVLMQWSCRDSFKKLIEKHQAEFEGAVIEYLKMEWRRSYQSLSDFIDGRTAEKPIGNPNLAKAINPLSRFFSDKVAERLKEASYRLEEWAKYDPGMSEQDRKIQFHVSESLKSLVGYVTGNPYHPSGTYDKVMKQADYAEQLLASDRPLSERDRREALVCVLAMKEFMEYQRSRRIEVEGLNAAAD